MAFLDSGCNRKSSRSAWCSKLNGKTLCKVLPLWTIQEERKDQLESQERKDLMGRCGPFIGVSPITLRRIRAVFEMPLGKNFAPRMSPTNESKKELIFGVYRAAILSCSGMCQRSCSLTWGIKQNKALKYAYGEKPANFFYIETGLKYVRSFNCHI